MTINNNGWRTQSLYSFGEASRLAEVSPRTIRNWLFGNIGPDRLTPPLFPSRADQGPMVSFIQLIEIVVAAQFRKAAKVPFNRVRSAYENAQKQYDIRYPFAHLQLEAIGGHIIGGLRSERPGASVQALDEPAQWTLPGLILDTIHQLEYDEDLAARWYPVGKEHLIVVDPRVSAGMPTILERGVTIQAIQKRWKVGHSISFIAEDFDLAADDVEIVLRYADRVAA